MTNPAFIKKLNLLLYYVCRGIKLTKGEYDILCLSLFKSYGFAGYKQFSWWIQIHSGKGVTKVISSSALWSVCEKYPSADGSYIPLKESHDNDARQLYGDNWCTLRGLNFRDLLDFGANHKGLPNLCWWHKILNLLPCRQTMSFQYLFNIAQVLNKCWNNIKCLQG